MLDTGYIESVSGELYRQESRSEFRRTPKGCTRAASYETTAALAAISYRNTARAPLGRIKNTRPIWGAYHSMIEALSSIQPPR